MLGADSATPFSAAAAKAAGFKVGARYINQSFNANELAAYNRADLILLPIYEESGKPGSFQDGQRQGQRARQILEGLGIGDYGCAFTDDVSGAPYSVVKEWVRGIRSTFPNHIVYYGPSHHGDHLVEDGYADSVWIEGAWSYSPGYNQHNPQPPQPQRHACGYQKPNQTTIGGVTVDLNEFFNTPWLPGQTKTSQQTEDWFDMATKEDLKAVLMDPEVKSALALEVLYWFCHAKTEGQKPDGKVPAWFPTAFTLDELARHVQNPPSGQNDEGTLRRAVDDIYTKVGA